MIDSTFVEIARDAANFGLAQIEKFSPVVWQMAQGKIMADAWLQTLGCIVCFVITIVASILTSKIDEDDNMGVHIATLIVALCTGAGALIFFCKAYYSWGMIYYAMDYYTLQTIIEMFGGR